MKSPLNIIAALLLALVSLGLADDPLKTELQAYLVVADEAGNETLQEKYTIQPGQILEYKLTCINTSDKALTDLSLVGPVPESTSYLAGSATAAGKEQPVFSIDQGKQFQAEPVRFTVALPDGTKEERVAPASMYTHIRWQIAHLAATTQITLRYRVSVK